MLKSIDGISPSDLATQATGYKHRHDFSPIAVVADQAWLRNPVTMFTPVFHGEIRLFSLSDFVRRERWIAGERPAAA